MSAIDVHAHAFPDAVAAKAIPQLEAGADWKAVGDGTVAGLLASMDAAGVERSVICSIATKPTQHQPILDWSLAIRSQRIVPLASVHPGAPDAADWVDRIADAGLAGIKLHPMYQDFAADEGRMDPIYAAAQRRGLIVTIHSGRDIAFAPDDDRASPARLRAVIDRHPALRFLCTHFGGWRDWEEVSRLLIGTPVLVETSFSLHWLDKAQAAEMIHRHGAGKFLFGTDWPWNRQDREIAAIEALGLSPQQTRAVLYDNAAALLDPSRQAGPGAGAKQPPRFT